MFLDRIRGAEQHEPAEQEHREFQRPENIRVETETGNDIGKGDQCHEPKKERDQRLLDPVHKAMLMMHVACPRLGVRFEKGGPLHGPPHETAPEGTGSDYMEALIACAASMFSWPTSSENWSQTGFMVSTHS